MPSTTCEACSTAGPFSASAWGTSFWVWPWAEKTFKLKFGHRGANQPVKDLTTGKIEITSQNHGFCVDMDSLAHRPVVLTHINLNDNTVEGLVDEKGDFFSVQYHPEASPGPHDASYLFGRFIELMRNRR